MTMTVPSAAEKIKAISRSIYSAPSEALQLSEQLLAESVACHDRATQVQASIFISITQDQLGQRFDGGQLLLDALAICEQDHLGLLEAQVLERLGRDRYTAGLYAESLEYWTRCIGQCRSLQHCGYSHIFALIGLGHICSAYNEYLQGAEFYRAAMLLLRLSPDPLIFAKAQLSLGWDLYNGGEVEEATQILKDSVEFSRRHGFGHYVSESLLHLGTVFLKAYDLVQAEFYLEEALEALLETPSHWVECNVLGMLAEVRFLQGSPQMARDMIERGIHLAQLDGMRHIEARLNAQAAGYCAALNDENGIEYYGHQLDRLHEINTDAWHIPPINLSNIRQYLPKK